MPERVTLEDWRGNEIGAEIAPIYSSFIQNVKVLSNNSSTANLLSGATYTGTSSSTLGVNSIQVTLKTDQNCTIYVDQSPDGTNWDINDTYYYYTSTNNFGITVQAVNSYVRVRVKNTGTATTTYFRLQTVLCPIVEALPRSLNSDGNLKTSLYGFADEYGFDVENTPNGEMRAVIPTLIIGKIFEGTTLDPNFWTSTVTNGGTVTQANDQVTLSTNTTANGTAKLVSVRRARYIAGQSMVARFQTQLGDIGATNNVRKWGIGWGASLPTITDGAYFQLNGTTFSIVTLKGTTATTVSSGNFNGKFGNSYTLDTNVHTYEIYFNNKDVFFTIDGLILHTVEATSSSWANTVQNHIYFENSNSNNLNTNHTLLCRAAGIRRLGNLLSQPTSKYQSGTTAGVVLKYGVGNLHGIVVSGVVNNSIVNLYDNTAASGTLIWSSGSMTNQTVPFTINLWGIPFFNGLTLEITTANCNVLVAYE